MQTHAARLTGTDRIRRTWSAVHVTTALVGDFVVATLAVDFARAIRPGNAPLPANVSGSSLLTYNALSLMTAALWLVGIATNGGYQTRRFRRLWEQAAAASRAVVVLLASVGVLSLLVRLQPSRAFVLTAAAALPLSWMSWRLALYTVMNGLARLGIDTERLLLVGPFDTTADIRRHLARTSATGTRVVAEHPGGRDISVVDDLLHHVDRHGITSVVVTDADALGPGVVRLLAARLSTRNASIVLMPSSPEAVSPAVELYPIGDLMLLRVATADGGRISRFGRSLLDRLIALGALLVGAPLLVGVAFSVAKTGRPILFRQNRVGQGGRPFKMLKFRTMLPNAEQMLKDDPALYAKYVANGFKLPAEEDPRITPTGSFLRRTSLDELPQLLNVLRGEMALVGPRPVVQAELAEYGELVNAYTALKPGLTGYWQINGRSDVGFPERADLDAYYHDHRSLRLDLRILTRTAITIASRRGAH